MKFSGTEDVTLELSGWIPANCAKKIIGEGIAPVIKDGKTRVRLQLARITDLRSGTLPLINFNYNEAIWHIAVEKNHDEAWYVLVCDIDHPVSRLIKSRFFHFNVRKSDFSLMEKRKSLITHHRPESGGELLAHIELGAELVSPEDEKKIYVRSSDDALYEIPLEKEPADFRRISQADIIRDEISSDIMGASVEWDPQCIVFRGRRNHISQAKKVIL